MRTKSKAVRRKDFNQLSNQDGSVRDVIGEGFSCGVAIDVAAHLDANSDDRFPMINMPNPGHDSLYRSNMRANEPQQLYTCTSTDFRNVTEKGKQKIDDVSLATTIDYSDTMQCDDNFKGVNNFLMIDTPTSAWDSIMIPACDVAEFMASELMASGNSLCGEDGVYGAHMKSSGGITINEPSENCTYAIMDPMEITKKGKQIANGTSPSTTADASDIDAYIGTPLDTHSETIQSFGIGSSSGLCTNTSNGGIYTVGQQPFPLASCSSGLTNSITSTRRIVPQQRRANANGQEQPRPPDTRRDTRMPRRTGNERTGPPDTYVSLGACNRICRHCKALFWFEERLKHGSSRFPSYNRCCMGGQVVLHRQIEYPAYIKELFTDRHFMENIRAYNSMFAMTSLGAQIDDSINRGRGPYMFKISGQIYHWIGSLCPPENTDPRFLQLYIYDTHNEVQNRLSHFNDGNHALREEIVDGLIHILDEHNQLVRIFRTARDLLASQEVPDFKIRLFAVKGSRQHELPSGDSIGAIIYEGGPDTGTEYDIIIHKRAGEPQRVSKLHPCYMAFQFPLLFIFGEDGFHVGLRLCNPDSHTLEESKKMSMKMYYAYQLHDRFEEYNLLTRSGRLFQQYVVTAYCSVEQYQLDYIREHQNDIRNEYLSGIYDAIACGDRNGSDVGMRTILPASFVGGPRYMYSHYLDALAICRVHGNPSFFITFTCNVRWPEIIEYMEEYPDVSVPDRPDVVDRIFEQKIHNLIAYLRDGRPFGGVAAILYTVEFQKRGLPHCHLLLWIRESSRVRTYEDIDRYISTELPARELDPEGYRIVSEFMMHGPCGLANRSAPCMKETDICIKGFPKPYVDTTSIDKNGYVHYRRRPWNDVAIIQNVELDNGYVVPYNMLLLKWFYAHINVEYYEWTMLIKYLFKYISKGTDRIVTQITRSIGDAPSTSQPQSIIIDEIRNYQDARYVGPHEACWRLLGFDIHYRDPAVQILAVHLEDMQRITFRTTETLASVVENPNKKKTTLTRWLDFNAKSTLGHHLTYLDFPTEFVWYHGQKFLSPRRNLNKPSIGRLAYVHPSAGDLFYQRLLLCHQKGCASFPAIRTVEGRVYPTNRAACEALGLLTGDSEWSLALSEAALTATASEMRQLFCQILIFCEVTNPEALWNRHGGL